MDQVSIPSVAGTWVRVIYTLEELIEHWRVSIPSVAGTWVRARASQLVAG